MTESLVELRQIMHGQLEHSQGTVHTLGEGYDTAWSPFHPVFSLHNTTSPLPSSSLFFPFPPFLISLYSLRPSLLPSPFLLSPFLFLLFPFSFPLCIPPSLLSLSLPVNSSNKLKETHTGMDEIGSKVRVSQSLISKLNRRDVTDKILIFMAVFFFLGVVLYIIRKRLIGWII